jgi:hypothetical protein
VAPSCITGSFFKLLQVIPQDCGHPIFSSAYKQSATQDNENDGGNDSADLDSQELNIPKEQEVQKQTAFENEVNLFSEDTFLTNTSYSMFM